MPFDYTISFTKNFRADFNVNTIGANPSQVSPSWRNLVGVSPINVFTFSDLPRGGEFANGQIAFGLGADADVGRRIRSASRLLGGLGATSGKWLSRLVGSVGVGGAFRTDGDEFRSFIQLSATPPRLINRLIEKMGRVAYYGDQLFLGKPTLTGYMKQSVDPSLELRWNYGDSALNY
jgi:hypothetical protein